MDIKLTSPARADPLVFEWLDVSQNVRLAENVDSNYKIESSSIVGEKRRTQWIDSDNQVKISFLMRLSFGRFDADNFSTEPRVIITRKSSRNSITTNCTRIWTSLKIMNLWKVFQMISTAQLNRYGKSWYFEPQTSRTLRIVNVFWSSIQQMP